MRQARIGPLASHNILFGDNGSGKTSILEAAHILGTARSFRAGSPRSLITHGEDHYVVQGECLTPAGSRRSLGVQRERNGRVQLRIAGESSRSIASLADELPLLLLDAESFDLLIGEPVNRRRFMDWGVFHVEHETREHRQRFQRALAQRNHLLRRDKLNQSELMVWTRDLAEQGVAVAEARRRFLEALDAEFRPLMRELEPDIGELNLAYRCGWDASVSYAEALERSQSSDIEQGFTQSGPQRADIRVTVDGYPVAETLSRGQQKLVVCALKLAQGRILAKRKECQVLYLLDDLPSELDSRRCERVCRMLAEMQAQTLITCIDAASLPVTWLSKNRKTSDLSATVPTQMPEAPIDVAVFHVKHGAVQGPLTHKAEDKTASVVERVEKHDE